MAGHDEDLEDDLAPAEDLLEDGSHSHGPPDDLDGVAKVHHERVLLPELAQHEARVC